MKKNSLGGLLLLMLLLFSQPALAVPVLQVGVPDGSGGWVSNATNPLVNPVEKHTVVTSGSTIGVAGLYKGDVDNLGGKFESGENWSSFLPSTMSNEIASLFNNSGAILLASVADGSGASAFSSLRVNGNLAFHWDASNSYFPNEHDPVKPAVSDFLFFDLGTFAKGMGTIIPDFQENGSGTGGEIKLLTLSGMEGLDWVHFDVMALATSIDTERQGRCYVTVITTDDKNNPGSHDVTWKAPEPPPAPVPEPGTLLLLGSGLIGLGLYRRSKKH